jgi:hypothetical protein
MILKIRRQNKKIIIWANRNIIAFCLVGFTEDFAVIGCGF